MERKLVITVRSIRFQTPKNRRDNDYAEHDHDAAYTESHRY